MKIGSPRACLALAAALIAFAIGGSRASADPIEPEIPRFITPEHFALELRGGPYQPDMGSSRAFDTFFSGDHGLLFGVELDVVAYRIRDLVYFDIGGRLSTATYKSETLSESGLRTSEETKLSLLPLDLMGVVRFDGLARQLSIPLVFTGKLGYEWMHWSASSGGKTDASGWSVGLVYGAQIAFDLDSLDRAAARNLDEEWGINHSFIFGEMFKFAPSGKSLPMGAASWAVGLGFMF